ncbi:MAG: GspE/PulE family protein [Verrucomicrobia bacterium]|nr:GspE/PulE family protein [Verrucomicrobiota bacterium]
MSKTNNESATSASINVDRLRELGREYGLTVLDAVPTDGLDPNLVKDLSVEWARANCLLPILMEGEVCVLSADPGQVTQQEYLGLLLGRQLRPVLASREVILASIEQCYYNRESSPDDFLRDHLAEPEADARRPRVASDDLLEVAEGAPVTQLVNLILLEAVKKRASDIHLEPQQNAMRVRYRIDGVLYAQSAPPKHMEESLVSRVKVMAHLDISERRLPQDGTARVRVGDREIDVRVSTIPVAEGERVVLRLLDNQSATLPLAELGLSPAMHTAFESALFAPNGIVLVCGPTGSGKTTTLYAALGQLDATRRNILTIEDPIEYQMPGIGQIQVKPKIGLTFANGLRHILRQDPDVILVGETRDLETAEIAMRAALTGHLVFTTLHTNDATGALLRLVDIGVAPHLLAACLRGVLAQRLVRRLCPACRREATITADSALLPPEILAPYLGRRVWEATGCRACLEGYAGRLGIFELLSINDELRVGMRTGAADEAVLRQMALRDGMVTLVNDGIEKVLAGQTSLAELAAVV